MRAYGTIVMISIISRRQASLVYSHYSHALSPLYRNVALACFSLYWDFFWLFAWYFDWYTHRALKASSHRRSLLILAIHCSAENIKKGLFRCFLFIIHWVFKRSIYSSLTWLLPPDIYMIFIGQKFVISKFQVGYIIYGSRIDEYCRALTSFQAESLYSEYWYWYWFIYGEYFHRNRYRPPLKVILSKSAS